MQQLRTLQLFITDHRIPVIIISVVCASLAAVLLCIIGNEPLDLTIISGVGAGTLMGIMLGLCIFPKFKQTTFITIDGQKSQAHEMVWALWRSLLARPRARMPKGTTAYTVVTTGDSETGVVGLMLVAWPHLDHPMIVREEMIKVNGNASLIPEHVKTRYQALEQEAIEGEAASREALNSQNARARIVAEALEAIA